MRKSAYSLLKALLLLCVPLLFCGAAPSGCAPGSRAAARAEAAPAAEAPPAPAPAGEAAGAETTVPAPALEAPVAPEAAGPGLRAAVLNAGPRLGDPVAVALALPPEPGQDAAALPRAFLLDSDGRRTARASFFSLGADSAGLAIMAALLAVPSTMKSGKAAVRIEGLPHPGLEDIPVTVEGREFVSETIDLDELNTALRTKPDPRKTREAEQLLAILRRAGTRIYAEGPFTPPVASTRRTSFYGDRRVYRY
ncbi:MAG: M23 family peptidase, partial [Treponema sp.]|nr:M23 family peptidase [Treponema sp.]